MRTTRSPRDRLAARNAAATPSARAHICVDEVERHWGAPKRSRNARSRGAASAAPRGRRGGGGGAGAPASTSCEISIRSGGTAAPFLLHAKRGAEDPPDYMHTGIRLVALLIPSSSNSVRKFLRLRRTIIARTARPIRMIAA